MTDLTNDLEYAASLTADEVSNLLAEVERLRDGIDAHRRSWSYGLAIERNGANKRLWSLLDPA